MSWKRRARPGCVWCDGGDALDGVALLGNAAGHAGRQLPAIRGPIAAALGNLPHVAFVVEHAINSSTPKSILKLGDDVCPCRFCAREMFVDVFDVDLHDKARSSGFRIMSGLTGRSDAKQSAAHFEPRPAAARPG